MTSNSSPVGSKETSPHPSPKSSPPMEKLSFLFNKFKGTHGQHDDNSSGVPLKENGNYICHCLKERRIIQKKQSEFCASILNHGPINFGEIVLKLESCKRYPIAIFKTLMEANGKESFSITFKNKEGMVQQIMPEEGESFLHFTRKLFRHTDVETFLLPDKTLMSVISFQHYQNLKNHPCHHGKLLSREVPALLVLERAWTAILYTEDVGKEGWHYLCFKNASGELLKLKLETLESMKSLCEKHHLRLLEPKLHLQKNSLIGHLAQNDLVYFNDVTSMQIPSIFHKCCSLVKIDAAKDPSEQPLSWAEFIFDKIEEVSSRDFKGEHYLRLPAPSNEKYKDRYSDVVPFKYNACSIHSNKYINASLIQAGNSSFIAAQGPIRNAQYETIQDFWQLAIEKEVSTIVALGNPMENGKVKYAPYFHEENGSIVIADGTIITKKGPDLLLDCDIYRDSHRVIRRQFCIHHPDGIQKTITHLHYENWTDMSHPSSSLLAHLSKEIHGSSGLPLIHCSAGAGRTGTLIAAMILETKIRKLQHHIKDKSKIVLPVIETVLELRSQRPLMVTSLNQFKFLFNHAIYLLE